MSKITEGRWEHRPSGGRSGKRGSTEIVSGDRTIAWIRGGYKDSFANGEAIKSLPEILEALYSMSQLAHFAYDYHVNEGYDDQADVIKQEILAVENLCDKFLSGEQSNERLGR